MKQWVWILSAGLLSTALAACGGGTTVEPETPESPDGMAAEPPPDIAEPPAGADEVETETEVDTPAGEVETETETELE